MRIIRIVVVAFFVLLIVIGGVVGVALYRGVRINELANLFQSTESFVRYTDQKFHLSFRYPKQWKTAFVSPNVTLFSEGAGVTMTLALIERKEVEALSDIGKKNIQEISESAKGANLDVTVEPVHERLLSSLQAESAVIHAKKDGGDVDSMQVWTVKGTKEYIFTLSARRAQFQTAVQVFQNVLESVQIK